jgi:surface protein
MYLSRESAAVHDRRLQDDCSQNCCFQNKTALQSSINGYINQECTTNSSCTIRSIYGNISTWCIKLIADMSYLFYDKLSFNEDISRWNVDSVTNMQSMFYNTFDFNQPLNSWNVSSVTNMLSMFDGASSFNQPLDSWNASSVTN